MKKLYISFPCLLVCALAQTNPPATMNSEKLNYTTPQGIVRTQEAKNQEMVSINDFRQNGDPDYTLAFDRAMKYAAMHPGARILLPCDTSSKVGAFFNITRGFTIPNATTLEGSSRAACFVNYDPPSNPGEVPAIISMVGSDGVTLRNFTLSASSKFPPKTGILLERNKTGGAAGHHLVQNLAIQGSYTIAAVYSISSEENLWLSNSIFLYGGGAKTAFYTSALDHFKVCKGSNCQNGAASNLTLWMIGAHIVNGQSNSSGITDVLDATGVGNHTYQNVYVGLHTAAGETGAGFVFQGPQPGKGTNNTVQVLSSNVENGGYFARFLSGPNTAVGTISRIVARDNTYESGSAKNMFNAAKGITLDAARFSNNSGNNPAGDSSVFDVVTNSTFDEDYQAIKVQTAARNNRFLGASPVTVPAGSEDANMWAYQPNSYSGKTGMMKPSTGLMLRPAGTAQGSAWGPSLNLPNGCCGAVPYPNPKAGDIFAENNQPYFYDGTASRPWLLGGTSTYSQLLGNPDNKTQPACAANNRGQFWFTNGAAGSADHLSVCRKAANNTYSWATVF